MEIKNPEVERLAFTLRNSGIAFSESEARRMAQSMVSTEKKVQTGFEKQRADMDEKMDRKNTMGELPPKESLEIQEVDQEEIKQQNIEKLREDIDQSKPVEIQVEYDTPETTETKETADSPELDTGISLKELMDEDAEDVYKEEEKPVLPEDVHNEILENKPSDKYNYKKPELEQEPPVVELEEVKETPETEALAEPEPPKQEEKPAMDTTEEEKVDLSNLFNFGNR